jgi:hypothetical protein
MHFLSRNSLGTVAIPHCSLSAQLTPISPALCHLSRILTCAEFSLLPPLYKSKACAHLPSLFGSHALRID